MSKDQKEREIPTGLEKTRTQKTQRKVSGVYLDSIAELASLLPLQLVNADTFHLLDSGPRYRRQFLDWGVFHVEPAFFPVWKRMQRILKQRNAALRAGAAPAQIQVWDDAFVESSVAVEGFREAYFEKLMPIFGQMLSQLIELPLLSIDYKPGWDRQHSLSTLLLGSLARDREQGNTSLGPHRSDLSIKVNRVPAEYLLSRGEQKLLVCALRLSQGALLAALTGKRCIYLLDDISAELDAPHCSRLFTLLSELKSQVFMTGTDKGLYEGLENSHLFHVEQGGVVRN